MAVLMFSGCPFMQPPDPDPDPDPLTWSVSVSGDLVSINHGSGIHFPQVAALDLANAYLRMVPKTGASFGTSEAIFPSFWTIEQLPPEPRVVADFGEEIVLEIESVDGFLFILTERNLYRSSDRGLTWENIHHREDGEGSFYALDADGSDVYASTWGGILKTDDYGQTFNSVFEWRFDPIADVDFENGFGWAVVANWGIRLKGLVFYDPEVGEWESISEASGFPSQVWVHADPVLSDTRAFYLGATIDLNPDSSSYSLGGHRVLLTYDMGEQVVKTFSRRAYSLDRGLTWMDLPADIVAAAVDETTGYVYAAKDRGDILWNRDDSWGTIDLGGLKFNDLTVMEDDEIFAISEDGVLYSVLGSGSTVTETYNQGRLTDWDYDYFVDGEDLVFNYSGVIAGVSVSEVIRFSQPEDRQFVANVTATTDAPDVINLANRPGEAFKVACFSSMRISENSWDAHEVTIGSTRMDLPFTEGWIQQPPIVTNEFSLLGGTSDWKENAVTMEIAMDGAYEITGWVTGSNNPNDDNIKLWAAKNEALSRWSYRITALSP